MFQYQGWRLGAEIWRLRAGLRDQFFAPLHFGSHLFAIQTVSEHLDTMYHMSYNLGITANLLEGPITAPTVKITVQSSYKILSVEAGA